MRKSQLQVILIDWINAFKSLENLFTTLVALLIGTVAGAGSWVVHGMIVLGEKGVEWSDEWLVRDLGFPEWSPLFIFPAFGGLIVGPLVYFFAKEAKGHGVSEVIYAVIKKGGVIAPKVGLVKALASALTISTGGSVGSEGPIVQIGSSIGSTIGKVFKVPTRYMRTFVGCGAAGGIAAAFNAPIAGALFAMEIILGEFGFAQFTPIVVSSVTATVVSRALIGDNVVFFNSIPEFVLVNPLELVSYAFLGVAAAMVALVFSVILYKSEMYIHEVKKVPEYLKPMIGGFLLGIIFLQFPMIWGAGTSFMERILSEQFSVFFLIALVIAKIAGTTITLASGGSGGAFAPSLFLGALTGKIVGIFSNLLMGQEQDSTGAFALVGMAAIVGATTHAPLTAFMIIFELTSGYSLILPLMISTVIAVSTARWLSPDSIYTRTLRTQGIDIQGGVELNVLKSVSVKKAIDFHVEAIPMDLPINFVVDLMSNSSLSHHPVVDFQNRLIGVVSTKALKDCLADKDILADFVIAADVITGNYVTIQENDNLDEVMGILQEKRLLEVYVTKDKETNELVGMVTKSALMDAYHREISAFEAGDLVATKIKEAKQNQIIEVIEDYGLLEIEADPEFDGKPMGPLKIRSNYGVNVLLIKRKTNKETKVWQPSPKDIIRAEDFFIIMGDHNNLQKIISQGWSK